MAKAKLNKSIYLSDIHNLDYFNELMGENKYAIFDKDEIMSNFKDQINLDEEAVTYLANIEIEKAFTRLLRNKKMLNVIYLMYTAAPIDVCSTIENIIVPKLADSYDVKMDYNIITTEEDYSTFNYKPLEKRFSNIYIKD